MSATLDNLIALLPRRPPTQFSPIVATIWPGETLLLLRLAHTEGDRQKGWGLFRLGGRTEVADLAALATGVMSFVL